jgi:hypothetical protein
MRKLGCCLVVAKTCGILCNRLRLVFCIGGRVGWRLVVRWIRRITVRITVRGITEQLECLLVVERRLLVWLLVWLLFCDASLLLFGSCHCPVNLICDELSGL